jgi:hypothetical protein
MTPKAIGNESKNRQKGSHGKGNNRVKILPTDWEKIFVNHTLDRGLTSKIYKVFKLLSKKKANKLI